ncbi:MAG: ADP-ribosylglycohydrolase family protein [Fimbriimonas sp.]|nr:ADP-ribosylglycohydrolase family protein [Fimbriimonas sp.]
MLTETLSRTYAGVLGKIIGVYLGRPFEGWPYREILAKLGEVEYYVHDRLNVPLVVTDDDISGTFTFLRALEDYDYSPNLTPEQIGQTWLNYIIENRTILWWGGMGMSTEHTAFLRMKHGIMPPASGSIATNGPVVAEQIGAQIFIDGWGLIHPGDPEKAADFARRAGSVSHDGMAIHCAQVVAALEAMAFVESDWDRLFDTALTFIPADGVIRRMIDDIRDWHSQGLDWQSGFEKIEAHYGYDKYGGNCHTVPNHAIIIHALLHGNGDFGRSLMIANTCGWDTDCNSGNVGCIMGVRNGLDGLAGGRDWRGPVADKIYLPTADGGRCVTDAAREALYVYNSGRVLREETPIAPKSGARFHFELPGSVQGFRAENCEIDNIAGHSLDGHRSLVVRCLGKVARVLTETFPTPTVQKMGGYSLLASPTVYAGQTVRLRVEADESNQAQVAISLILTCYPDGGEPQITRRTAEQLLPGGAGIVTWDLPFVHGNPITELGIEIQSNDAGERVYLDYLTWDGAPSTTFRQVAGDAWKQQWVCGVSEHLSWGEPFRIVQNEGTGLLMTGCREWTDYEVEAAITPHLAETAGIAARVQGMKRYYALELVRGGGVRLVKALDGEELLQEALFEWELGETHLLRLQVVGNDLVGIVDGKRLLEASDWDRPLLRGGIALVLKEGRMSTDEVRVGPVIVGD